MDPIEVACNCGAVNVRLTAPPMQQFYCHCDDCQQASGGPYVTVAVFPASSVDVRGETDAWTLRMLPRHRCRSCGTHMFGEVPGGEIIGSGPSGCRPICSSRRSTSTAAMRGCR